MRVSYAHLVRAFEQIKDWPVRHAAVGVVARDGARTAGDTERVFPLASVTKPLVAYAVLVAVEEGATLVRVGTAIFGERRPR